MTSIRNCEKCHVFLLHILFLGDHSQFRSCHFFAENILENIIQRLLVIKQHILVDAIWNVG